MSFYAQLRRVIAGGSANHSDDVAPQTSRDLPSEPHSNSSLSDPPPSAATAAIDLTSPTRRTRSPKSEGKPSSAQGLRRPLARVRRSADERRLVGDYDVPADRVFAPDPQTYFQSPARKTMGKPVPIGAFKPVNTINDVNRGHGNTRPVRYGKESRHRGPAIGKAQGLGQAKYLETQQNRRPATSDHQEVTPENSIPRNDQASSLKRRKTEHVPSEDIIDLVEDDDLQEVASYSTPNTPALHAHRPSLPKSEFLMVDKMLDSRRRRSKKSSNQQDHISHQMSPLDDSSSSASNLSQSHDNHTSTSKDKSSKVVAAPRRSILESFEQGVGSPPLEEDVLMSDKSVTTSRYFSKARINESTSHIYKQHEDERPTNNKDENLRKFRRTNHSTTKIDSASDDELGMNLSASATAAKNRSLSSGGQSQTIKSRRRRSSTEEDAIPLKFARSHNFTRHMMKLDDGQPDLVLKSGAEPGIWCIDGFDLARNDFVTQEFISPKAVIKVQADDTSRLRLEGPRQPDGSTPIFDLEFWDQQQFQDFCQVHAVSFSTRRKIIIREKSCMERIFCKPLLKNDKVNTASAMDELSLAGPDSGGREDNTSTISLLSHLKKSTSAPAQRSGRPVRSTRSSAPSHDVEDNIHNGVEKYSIEKGLGQTWLRPLTYGEGRQKATVYFDDLPRLDEEEFMNDSLIDFYIIYLFDKSKIPRDKVYIFNTYFFTQLTRNTGRDSMNYKAVERWTSKVDVFNYDYIVVPINEDTHWYLAVICNVANINRKPVMEDFDESSVTHEENAGSGNQTAEHGLLSKVQINGTSSAPRSPERQGTGDKDVNLYDEDDLSKVDLVDPEDSGKACDLQQEVVDVESEANLTQRQVTYISQANSGSGANTTVLPKLQPSIGRKKGKRKPIAPKRDPNQPIILILDSLGNTRSATVRALKDWLAAEGVAKRGMEAVIKEKGFYPKASQIPMQNNWTDCGVYLLGYAEKFFQDPDTFKNKLVTGEMSAAEDWPELRPKDMRNNLREIIFKLADEHKLTERRSKKAKKTPTTVNEALSSDKPEVAKVNLVLPSNQQHEIEGGQDSLMDITEDVARIQGDTKGETSPEKQPPNEPSAIRLGSPFSPRLRPPVQRSKREPPNGDAKRSRSPSLSNSSKPKAISQDTDRISKRWGVEIRISGEQQNDMEPSKNVFPAVTERAKIQVTKTTHSPLNNQVTRSPLDPAKASQTDGGLDYPIEIEDSQENQLSSSTSLKRKNGDSPKQRKSVSTSPRKLRHALSIEEIPTPTPQASPSKNHSPRGEKLVGKSLGASLNEVDERNHQLGQSQEEISAHVDSNADMMEIDSEVRETPEYKRRSP